jgi:hypothetical protein
MGRRPLVVLAAVAIALPLAGAIAPASGLTSRGVSTPLGVGMHVSRHSHLHALSSGEAVATRSHAPITVARRVPQQPHVPAPPVQNHPATHHPAGHGKKHQKKPGKKPPKKHHKPTPGGSGPPPHKKKSH